MRGAPARAKPDPAQAQQARSRINFAVFSMCDVANQTVVTENCTRMGSRGLAPPSHPAAPPPRPPLSTVKRWQPLQALRRAPHRSRSCWMHVVAAFTCLSETCHHFMSMSHTGRVRMSGKLATDQLVQDRYQRSSSGPSSASSNDSELNRSRRVYRRELPRQPHKVVPRRAAGMEPKRGDHPPACMGGLAPLLPLSAARLS